MKMRRDSTQRKCTAVFVMAALIGHGLQPMAWAASLPLPAAAAQPQSDEKISQGLEAIERKLDDLAQGGGTETSQNTRVRLKDFRREFDVLDRQANEDFNKIEKNLKRKKIPQTILDRHAAAVKRYKNDARSLRSAIDAVERAADGVQRKAAARKAWDGMAAKRRRPVLNPIDPDNLPFRSSRSGKTRKPSERKEDFKKYGWSRPAPVQLAASEIRPGMLAAPSPASTPIPADTAEALEVRFTGPIKSLAAGLSNDPVKIYEHVKNNFVFEPYFGSLKGADETLAQGAGNDFDLASLLIALLRTSGVPARYAVGTVDVPIEKTMGWLGVGKPEVAADIFAAGGTPSTAMIAGGKIVSLRLEHVWVEAYVPYDNYRGHALSGGKQWIPLDPGFKQLKYTPGPDLTSMMGLEAQALVNEAKATATIDADVPSMTSVSEDVVGWQVQALHERLEGALAASIPNATPQDLMDRVDILSEPLGLLPASLPYNVVVDGSRFSQAPESVRYRARFEVQGDPLSGGAGFAYETTLTELAGKKVTLAYEPATPADAETLLAHGKLSNTPAYLVEMRPILLVDGAVKASGGGKGLGEDQLLTTTYIFPGPLGSDRVATRLVVGSYYAVGLALPKVSKRQLNAQAGRLESLAAAVSSGAPLAARRDDVLGDILHVTAINYFYNLGAAEDLLSRFSGLVLLRQPSSAVTFVDVKVSRVFGVPRTVRPVGLSIDANRHVVSPVSRAGEASVARAFLLQTGVVLSQLEHEIFERMFNVHAISAAKAFGLANAEGIPLLAVHQSNVDRVLPALALDPAVKDDVQAAAGAGKLVILPKADVSFKDWRGAGYLVLDPVTFASAYRIRGGINGGSTAGNPGGVTPLEGVTSCAISGPWSALLDEIDFLLRLADGALLREVDIKAHANSLCILLAGIKTAIPEDINKAERILQAFRWDVVVMIEALKMAKGAHNFITAMGLLQGGKEAVQAALEYLLILLITKVPKDLIQPNIKPYAGYFILHYLYEYVVLFNAGLLSAFPEGY
jgi:hypothetical protein